MENIDELIGTISYVNIGGGGEQGPPGPPGKDGKGIFFADKNTLYQDIVDAVNAGNVVYYRIGPKNFPRLYQYASHDGLFMHFIKVDVYNGIPVVSRVIRMLEEESEVTSYTLPYADVPNIAGTWTLQATREEPDAVVRFEWVGEV